MAHFSARQIADLLERNMINLEQPVVCAHPASVYFGVEVCNPNPENEEQHEPRPGI